VRNAAQARDAGGCARGLINQECSVASRSQLPPIPFFSSRRTKTLLTLPIQFGRSQLTYFHSGRLENTSRLCMNSAAGVHVSGEDLVPAPQSRTECVPGCSDMLTAAAAALSLWLRARCTCRVAHWHWDWEHWLWECECDPLCGGEGRGGCRRCERASHRERERGAQRERREAPHTQTASAAPTLWRQATAPDKYTLDVYPMCVK